MYKMSGRFSRVLWILAVVLLAGCATNPATGEREFTLVTEEQEIALGRQTAQQVEQSLGFVEDAALQAYVQRLGEELAATSERPHLPWTFRVVDDPTPNAFAVPGGFIYVTRGLLNLMDSEAELATVLGHEIAHVTARHSAQAITRQQLAQVGLGLGSVLVPELQQFGDVLGGGLQLLFMKYGRGAEREADEFGFEYALERGYDVREMDDVFASLQRLGELEEASVLPTWLATHPAPAERIEAVEQRLATLEERAGTARLGRAEYLGQIDNLVYGADPRAGFFREGVFYHPELRFRFALPRDWQRQNMARAVVGASPQGDAAAQLTLVPQLGPTEAARQFLDQQGIQAGRTTRETINGIPAVVSTFQAQTQQGVIGGYVAFLEYGGNTYQLLTYAPAARLAEYGSLFQQIIGSFGPVTDPEILNATPQRIDIVRLEENLSLAEFNRRYPSVIPIERLALLNQVEDVSAAIAAGTLVKRVVDGEAALP